MISLLSVSLLDIVLFLMVIDCGTQKQRKFISITLLYLMKIYLEIVFKDPMGTKLRKLIHQRQLMILKLLKSYMMMVKRMKMKLKKK